MKTFIDSARP